MADITLTNVAPKNTADTHYANTSNPHSVTKSQVGLSNVPNTDATNPSNITQDATHRFATDAEKATWNALIGGSIFQSVWNATTNSPSLASGIGTKGFYYIISVAGSTNIDGITDWKVGDWAIFDGTVWRKVDNTDAVSSVNSLTGAVSLDSSNVPDTSNKRYVTDAQLVVVANTTNSNSGDETGLRIGVIINAATDLPTPLNADQFGVWDVINGIFRSVTWANIKATLKTYFDTLYTSKLITANRQTDSYTLVLGDADKIVEMNKATVNNLTVPTNASVAFSTGTQILLSQYGAGQTTVVAAGGVTIRSSGGKLKLVAQYSGATLIKIASDEWYLFGDITA